MNSAPNSLYTLLTMCYCCHGEGATTEDAIGHTHASWGFLSICTVRKIRFKKAREREDQTIDMGKRKRE